MPKTKVRFEFPCGGMDIINVQEVIDGITREAEITRTMEYAKMILESEEFVYDKICGGGKHVVRPGLVLEYILFENSGNDLHDTCGQGLHALAADGNGIVGATWTQLETGKPVLDFPGANNYIKIPDNTNINFNTGPFTLMFWVKTPATTDVGIINKCDLIELGYYVYMYYSGIVAFNVGDTVFDTGDVAINDNRWHLVACVRDNDVGKIYVDGVLAEWSVTDGLATKNASYAAPLYVGSNIDGMAGYFQ